eukprot:14201384-Heterocapsa_arctica.AAC.1
MQSARKPQAQGHHGNVAEGGLQGAVQQAGPHDNEEPAGCCQQGLIDMRTSRRAPCLAAWPAWASSEAIDCLILCL